MNESIMVLVMAGSGALFAMGGTEIIATGRGYKWIRRFVLPLFLIGVALLHSTWWQAVGYGVTLCAFLHLGYGDRCNWWKRIAIFTGYGASALWFGWSWWVVITPVVLSVMFLLSNTKATAQTFFWKVWEMAMGFLIAVTFISSISSPG